MQRWACRFALLHVGFACLPQATLLPLPLLGRAATATAQLTGPPPAFPPLPQEGTKHYYLALDVYVEGNWENPLAQICLTFLTFWILLSYLVPISLFVTLEIVKFWQV